MRPLALTIRPAFTIVVAQILHIWGLVCTPQRPASAILEGVAVGGNTAYADIIDLPPLVRKASFVSIELDATRAAASASLFADHSGPGPDERRRLKLS
jgi:hypothetical protein